MNNYTVFDTETTGLPPRKSNWRVDYMEFPYIVQLAWKSNTIKQVESHIIKPDGWVIPEESTKIHGITQERALKEGVELRMVLDDFLHTVDDGCDLIGHNVHFDTSIIAANVLKMVQQTRPDRINYYIEFLENRLSKDKRICTMYKTIKFCGLTQADSNRAKIPSLIELHNILFSESFPAHDAGEDTKATERCYLKLVELGVI